jgi:hypothetical protein
VVHSVWTTWVLIIAANLALIALALRCGARRAGRKDWVRACWEIRRELALVMIPRRLRR